MKWWWSKNIRSNMVRIAIKKGDSTSGIVSTSK